MDVPAPETKTTLSAGLTPRELAFITAAAEIEAVDAASAGTVGFVSPLLARFSLPLRDPGAVARWERRNGDQRLIMRPAAMTDAKGNDIDGYPFGLYPRLIMTYLATEAVTKQTPHVSVGTSLNDFMASLGLYKDGQTRRRFKDQVVRLTGASLTVKHARPATAQGQMHRSDFYTVADSVNVWVPATDDPADAEAFENVPDIGPAQRLVWPEMVHLSLPFYFDLTTRAVPVDTRALRALSPWPMAMDVYVWLTWRLHRLTARSRPIPWAQLAEQFGSSDKLARRFKAQFMDVLDTKVHPLYPAASYHATAAGLVLYPSPTHVPMTKKRRQGETPAASAAQPDQAQRDTARGVCPTHGVRRTSSGTCTGCIADRKAKEA
ncbi:replication protein RepA [Promicromonospora sukumoe]|uniref:replication protein RepA n=1 Tax=Promicromonospora sukumoe TaxID=88382 RepID=UPI0037CAB67A